MRVIKNQIQTILWFLILFGGFLLLALAFLYLDPVGNDEPRTFRIAAESEPITLEEYSTLLDPGRPDPRHSEYRHAQHPKQASRN